MAGSQVIQFIIHKLNVSKVQTAWKSFFSNSIRRGTWSSSVKVAVTG